MDPFWNNDRISTLLSDISAENRLQFFLLRVRDEVGRQLRKWGEQNHPDLTPVIDKAQHPIKHARALGIPSEKAAKARYKESARRGHLNWGVILVEEVAEVIHAAAVGDTKALQEELVQVAAVCLSWSAAIDRREGGR